MAHLIKGVMTTFGAQEVIDYAEQIESLGRTGNLEGAQERFESLSRSLDKVAGTLASFIENPQPYLSKSS